MAHQLTISRRKFVRHAGLLSAASVGFWSELGAKETTSPNERLNIAAVGLGNRGVNNVHGLRKENIVAICDVDERFFGPILEAHPKAATYRDFRKILERPNLDAVVISTPDHTHAPCTLIAMRSGFE